LNSGQQVDFLLARIAGPYMSLASFDTLPTPFRTIAVDLVTGQQVVIDKGALASALRATMSLPGIFPPVEREGMVLVDGGAMNNVPADVVRAMGANTVIAINVGFMGDTRTVSGSLFGLMGQTIDTMMTSNTRRSLESADIVINPDLKEYGSLDWRRSRDLEREGYAAAEALKDRLLPLALSESEWAAYQQQRQSRRRREWPMPQTVRVSGAIAADAARIEQLLGARVAQPLDVDGLETDLETLTGLDRYETVGWHLDDSAGQVALVVEARPKSYAPPFLMLGINLQNTTTETFSFQMAARYLTFDKLGAGSELRLDGVIGAQPGAAAEVYWPIRKTPLFVTAGASARRNTFNIVRDDVVAARYDETRALVGFTGGVNVAAVTDVRVGISFGHLDASVEAGDPELPEVSGGENRAWLQFRHDSQDSPVVPSRGVRAAGVLTHILDAPDLPPGSLAARANEGVTQIDVRASNFWSLGRLGRTFVVGGIGSSWGDPLPTEQFELGSPLRLGGLDAGELRGDHYGVVTAGYLRGVARLPDFLGGPIWLGGWVENGSAFNDIDDATWQTNLSTGVIADTLIGPALLAASIDVRGGWRYYIGIGRLF
jgi:NTE family protein